MAEYVSARIRIGGRLSVEHIQALWERVLLERVGPSDGLFSDVADFERHLRACPGGVTLYGDEVRSGEFGHLQAFCVEHALTHMLTYDGCGGEWGPARRRWRPGDGEGTTCSLDSNGGFACITAGEITRFGFEDVEAIRAHLAEFDDEVVPPLVLVES